MLDLPIMHKRLLILFFPCLLLAGCGIKGPLYLPPDPNDSYLSRIGKQINELTDQDMVGEAPTPVREKQVPIPVENQSTDPVKNTEPIAPSDTSDNKIKQDRN